MYQAISLRDSPYALIHDERGKTVSIALLNSATLIEKNIKLEGVFLMEFHDFDQLLSSREFSTTRAVISIGVFDGLHKGHQAIISAAHERAMESEGVKTVVFTFAQNPKMMLSPSTSKPPLLSMRQTEKTLRTAPGRYRCSD